MASEAYRHAQGLGKASATTTQRLADIQKIVSPPKKGASARSAAAAAPADSATGRAISNMTMPQTPSFQFGGANGSLAMPPYMAPSQ
jgi:hypothetical protein